MKEYLANYEELEQLVDSLIAKKYPNEPADKYRTLREKSISELDETIGSAIFGSLTKPELDELNQLLDQESTTEEDYDNFFKNANLDLAKITEQAAKDYIKKFMEEDEGGNNA